MSRLLSGLPRWALSAACGCAALAASQHASAITREEVIATAKAFVYHPWRCETKNLTASCSSTYKSYYIPGDYLGLPYDWGGFMNLFQFDQQIAAGYGAGSPYNGDILSCTAGVDCSAFVSQCFHSSYHTTTMLPNITTAISQSQLLPGDILNSAGYHVVLFSHLLGSGEPYLYEASPPNSRVNAIGGWSNLNGYIPRRYTGITGTTAGNPPGTLDNPIVIGAFPYTDSRNTSLSASDVLDGCALAPNTKETGPEFVYQVKFTQPGTLTVSVSDDAAVDIDVHLYGSSNTSDCLARHDTSFTKSVDCGTYLIVADTFAGTTEYPGAYTLNVNFTPAAGACGSGPPSYAPKGKLGESCSEAFPYCNYTFGAEVCILTNPPSDSFCSKACKTDSDCTQLSGCCKELGSPGSGEYYCLKSPYCPGTQDAGAGGSGQGGAGGSPPAGGSAGEGGTISQGGAAGQGGAGQGGSAAGSGGSGAQAGNGQGGSVAQGGSGQGGSAQSGAGGAGGDPDPGYPIMPADPVDEAGCGCRVVGSASGSGWSLAGLLGLLVMLRKKRNDRRPSA